VIEHVTVDCHDCVRFGPYVRRGDAVGKGLQLINQVLVGQRASAVVGIGGQCRRTFRCELRLVVRPHGLRGGTIDAAGDHRLAMMGAVAGLASREGVTVLGMEAAAVSYPGFVQDIKALSS